MADRLSRLRGALADGGLDGFLAGHRPSIRYLTGFSGSSGALLVTARQAVLVTDSRYALQAREEVDGIGVEIAARPPLEAAAEAAPRGGRIGFEAEHLSVAAHAALAGAAEGRELVASSGIVERMRAVKDAAEIERIAASVRLTSRAFEAGLAALKAGAPETEVAAAIEFEMRRLGAEGPAFESIVASGPRGALPHGRASSKEVRAGEAVVVDIGAMLGGYASDMTRTVFAGEPDGTGERVHAAVLEALRRAQSKVRAGARISEVDEAARGALAESGVAKESYGHGTGHGVGLEVHEAPRIGRNADGVLEAGMVVTIEPGVYVPGWGGVRIEDVVVVEEKGCRILTPTSREIRTV